MSKRVLAVARFTVVMLAAASPLLAATMTKLSDDALAPLRGASVLTKTIRLDKLPLYDSKRSVIELEEFQVWAPGAKVIIHGDNGVILEKQDPPPMRFFRGLVNGSSESFAYFSVDPTGKITGLIDTGGKKLAISSARRIAPTPRNRNLVDQPVEYFMAEADDSDVPLGTTWVCQVDKTRIVSPSEPIHATGINGRPVTAQGITGTQSYSITVQIETDYELFHIPGGDSSSAVTTYITNLTGAVSTIYNRDLKTNVVQGTLNIYTTVSDPWSATTPSAGLDELGDHYHSCTSCTGLEASIRTTSEVIFFSGKNIGGGIAWEGVVCGSDFFQNSHWGGPYAWCAGIGNLGGTMTFGSIPDVSTPPYTMPSSGTQSFWPLAEYAHEMGHNLGGHHTHCVQTTDAERIAAGFTDGSAANSTSNQVDHCFAHEGLAGCFAGATDNVAGAQTTFNGTIMSYCHNTSPQASHSRFTFGQPVEGSHNELDNYMLRTLGPLNSTGTAGFDGGSRNIVNGVGSFTISAITAPASVTPNSTGNSASITSTGGTYAWTISGGSITAGQTTNAITFTAGASGTVILRATSYNATLCGVTDTKSVPISGVTFNPPTNVVATATSLTNVNVTWTAASGTPPGRYNVWRTTNVSTTAYTQVGNTTGTSFSDTTASANTSYMYKVRSADAGGANESADSNLDLATTVIFTNPTLSAGVSVIQKVDTDELRLAIDKVRALGNTGAAFYSTDTTITAGVTTVKAQNVIDMRTFLNVGRTNAGIAGMTFTNSLNPTSTIISALDFNEIRAGVQ